VGGLLGERWASTSVVTVHLERSARRSRESVGGRSNQPSRSAIARTRRRWRSSRCARC